jgi:hypothetical protein
VSQGWRVPAAAFLWRRLSAQCVVCSGGGAQEKGKLQKGKGKAKERSGRRAVRQGGGGGEQQWRGQHVAWGGQPLQHLASGSASHHSTVEDAVQAALPSAEASSGTQQPAGGGKKEKERHDGTGLLRRRSTWIAASC